MKKRRPIPTCYDSLDAPVFIWHKVHETRDLSWLLVKRQKVSGLILSRLEKAWVRIYDEYLEEFGKSEEFMMVKRKEAEISCMQVELILTGDRTLETFIEIAQQELNELRGEMGKGDFMESKIALETKLKFQINLMNTSIREFYSYLKYLKNIK
jgi:hypothetical protein